MQGNVLLQPTIRIHVFTLLRACLRGCKTVLRSWPQTNTDNDHSKTVRICPWGMVGPADALPLLHFALLLSLHLWGVLNSNRMGNSSYFGGEKYGMTLLLCASYSNLVYESGLQWIAKQYLSRLGILLHVYNTRVPDFIHWPVRRSKRRNRVRQEDTHYKCTTAWCPPIGGITSTQEVCM